MLNILMMNQVSHQMIHNLLMIHYPQQEILNLNLMVYFMIVVNHILLSRLNMDSSYVGMMMMTLINSLILMMSMNMNFIQPLVTWINLYQT